MPQGLGAGLAGTRHPFANSPFANAQRFGDLVLRPVFLFEVPGLEPPSFFPGRGNTVHAPEYRTQSLPSFSY